MILCSCLPFSKSDMSRKMFTLLPIVLLDTQLHLMTALFRVDVLQSLHSVEYGSNVTMRCYFPVTSQLTLKRLNIVWAKTSSKQDEKEIYKLRNGQEDLTQQDPDYRGRATLVHKELQMGCSALSITNVTITDAGSFLCVVTYGEADYKYITLEVKAPYKRINIQKIRNPEEESLILICQSEGYPLAEVSWYDARNVSVVANTSFQLTNDGLFNVTSFIQVKPSSIENYTCVFWNKKLNENTSTHLSALPLDYEGEPASGYQKLVLISFILAIGLLVLCVLAVIIIKVRRRKSSMYLCIRRGNCRNASHSSRVKEEDVNLEITSSPLI